MLLLPIAESNVTAIGGLDRHHGLAVEVFHGLDFAVRVHNEVQEVVVVRLGDQVVLLTSRRAEEGAADQIVLAFLEANKCILVFKSRVLELDVLVLIVDFLQNFVFKPAGLPSFSAYAYGLFGTTSATFSVFHRYQRLARNRRRPNRSECSARRRPQELLPPSFSVSMSSFGGGPSLSNHVLQCYVSVQDLTACKVRWYLLQQRAIVYSGETLKRSRLSLLLIEIIDNDVSTSMKPRDTDTTKMAKAP